MGGGCCINGSTGVGGIIPMGGIPAKSGPGIGPPGGRGCSNPGPTGNTKTKNG